MKGLALGLAAIVVSVLAVPMLAAVTVMAISAPAIEVACNTGGAIAPTGSWRPPFQQRYVLTSPFGMRYHPIYHVFKLHSGQDLVSQPSPGPVVAAAGGTVISATYESGFGNAVRLRHTGGIVTLYGHMARINTRIKSGVQVTGGQVLGIEGSTGASTGNHLHFEVQQGGKPINPVPFMRDRGAPLDGRAVAPTPKSITPTPASAQEGGIGFELPTAGKPRLNSLHNPELPIPARVRKLYVAAANRYKIPWTLLAGIGMEETGHGRNNTTSSAGAQGLMQFMPGTWAAYGVDGNGDGRAVITNDADSVMSAANYLTASGATKGAAGVRRALFAYNHANWYVNGVLYYAHSYGGGTVLGDVDPCPDHGGDGNPNLPPLTSARIETVLRWAQKQIGEPYVFGANGPNDWDCSSYTKAAYAQIGITMPRTADAQRDWLAAGNGHKVPLGKERPGDLVFTDTFRGPNLIGHVMLVFDPTSGTSIEAGGSRVGHYKYTRYRDHHIFEIWRVGNLT